MKNISKKLFFTISIFMIMFLSRYCLAVENSDIQCNKAIVVDMDSKSILYSKSGFQKVYPASTTKILTAILVLENLPLDKVIVVSDNAINITPEESSVMDAKAGELLTIEQLLYGLMLPSGNDAANILAEAVSGNVDEFVSYMNKKAIEIGCTNTHFTNPHGFHDDNHYTSVNDMAKILLYALKNDDFKKIIETKYYEIPPTNIVQETRKYVNTNKLVNPNYSNYYYEYVLGGKTGFTDEARGTLISYAKKDNKNVIVAAFDGTQLIGNEVRYYDSKKLFEFAFNDFNFKTVLKNDDYKVKIYDEKNKKIYTLKLKEDISSLHNDTNYNIYFSKPEINFELLNTQNDVLIYNQDETFGIIDVKLHGKNIYLNKTCDLILDDCVDTTTFDIVEIINNMYFKIILIVIILAIIICLIKTLRRTPEDILDKRATKLYKNYIKNI